MRYFKLTLIYPFVVLAAIVGLIGFTTAILVSPSRAWHIARGFDQVVNAVIKGDEDETISSRAGKGARRGTWHWCIICKLLNMLDPNHCEAAMEPDEGKPIPELKE